MAKEFVTIRKYFYEKLEFNCSSNIRLDLDFIFDLFDNVKSNFANKEVLKTFSCPNSHDNFEVKARKARID